MRSRVSRVVSELVIELEDRWTFARQHGHRVKIAGLLPSSRDSRESSTAALRDMIEGKPVEIAKFISLSGSTVLALVNYKDCPIQDAFPKRQVPMLEPSRWIEPAENKSLVKVFGGIPTNWRNPIAHLPSSKAPFFGNLTYPLKFWRKGYEASKRLVSALYTDSHANREELTRWFNVFLESPQREAPLVVIGMLGVGKSWWIARQLSELPREEYHPILVDLRYCRRAQNLEDSIEDEIGSYLNEYVTDFSWLYSDLAPLYGDDFDPDDPDIRQRLLDFALEFARPGNLTEYNRRRLRFYDRDDSPQLIVAFDNIDNFTEEEQLKVADLCTRIIGSHPGVKVIITLRPCTLFPLSRLGLVSGESISRPVVLKSPKLESVLRRRLGTTSKGEQIDPNEEIAGSSLKWRQLLRICLDSDTKWGMLGFLKDMCATTMLSAERGRSVIPSGATDDLGATYDLRHFIKLVRRVLRSDCLEDLRNVGNNYYGIHALMMRAGEPVLPGDACLFNLFDNERPDLRGNALVRYRVLEYCRLFGDLGQAFDVYFRALGCGESIARAVVEQFQEAGLVKVEYVHGGRGEKMPTRAELTTPGERHLEVIENLWYIICVKTGMHVYPESILRGVDARKQAARFVKSKRILGFYSSHGWVSEELFLEFIGQQEALEQNRIGQFQESHEEWRDQVANMVEKMSSPAEILYWNYHQQLRYWTSG